MERNSLNEALKRKAVEAQKQEKSGEQALDDSRRVKVLSPSRLVVKRFFRNRLAMIGLIVLIAIFIFCYLGPFFYPYGQSEVFKHYKYMQIPYATANFNKEFNHVPIPGVEDFPDDVRRSTNSRILTMLEAESPYSVFFYEHDSAMSYYLLSKLSDNVYQWSNLSDREDGRYVGSVVIASEIQKIGDAQEVLADDGSVVDAGLVSAANQAFTTIKGSETVATFEYNGANYNAVKLSKLAYRLESAEPSILGLQGADDAMIEAATNAVATGVNAFTAKDGTVYAMKMVSTSEYVLEIVEDTEPVSLFTDYSFKIADQESVISAELKAQALLNERSGGTFDVDGVAYHVNEDNGGIVNADGTTIAVLTNISLVDANAQDTFSVEFADALADIMTTMDAANEKKGTMVWGLVQKDISFDEQGEEILIDKVDENGEVVIEEETLTIDVQSNTGTYNIRRNSAFWVNKAYAPMTKDHPLGTDGNGMDMLARMMYGGRVSLMVGFVVVILSMVIGVVLGGIAGYFGGWVDTLVMRLVEIFYCIPHYPILIILGGYMDAMRMDKIVRLYVMMAVLGILSWAGVARLVRGQILSLREQEFMVATEATGTKVRHRIFRHLVPNVMPQLIVSATGSLGGVILTESSLSFLGLGVKYPIPTWGNMIEFVTGLNENLGRYIYIWLPVGLMICLTVISFNFVGDGLRDAFDPKMKR